MNAPAALAALFLVAARPTLQAQYLPAATHNQPNVTAPAYERDLQFLRFAETGLSGGLTSIANELATLNRSTLLDSDWAKEWAGVYGEGGGGFRTTTIYLAPKSGIASLTSSCSGPDKSLADIDAVLPDGLKLKSISADFGDRALSERMYFIRWADRRFLIADYDMLSFVNNYNRGGYYRQTMPGIPELKPDVPPTPKDDPLAWTPGKPQLPPQYAKLLREAPIKLRVTSVAPFKDSYGTYANTYEIQYEGGIDQGAYIGLEFSYPDPVMSLLQIKLTRVDPTASVATLTASLVEGREPKLPAIGEVLANTKEPFTRQIVTPTPAEKPEVGKKDPNTP